MLPIGEARGCTQTQNGPLCRRRLQVTSRSGAGDGRKDSFLFGVLAIPVLRWAVIPHVSFYGKRKREKRDQGSTLHLIYQLQVPASLSFLPLYSICFHDINPSPHSYFLMDCPQHQAQGPSPLIFFPLVPIEEKKRKKNRLLK